MTDDLIQRLRKDAAYGVQNCDLCCNPDGDIRDSVIWVRCGRGDCAGEKAVRHEAADRIAALEADYKRELEQRRIAEDLLAKAHETIKRLEMETHQTAAELARLREVPGDRATIGAGMSDEEQRRIDRAGGQQRLIGGTALYPCKICGGMHMKGFECQEVPGDLAEAAAKAVCAVISDRTRDRLYVYDVCRAVLSAIAPALRQQGAEAERERAAKLLDVSASEIRLHAGEMSAQEMQSVRAVLAWMQRTIREGRGGE